jgi:hypothetical protein
MGLSCTDSYGGLSDDSGKPTFNITASGTHLTEEVEKPAAVPLPMAVNITIRRIRSTCRYQHNPRSGGRD